VNLDTSYTGPLPLANLNIGKLISVLFFKQNTPWSNTLAWQVQPAIKTRSDAIRMIESLDIWAAIILPEDMTTSFSLNTFPLNQQQPTLPLQQTNVTCEIIYNQARAFSIENIMLNIIQSSLSNISKDLARILVQLSNEAGLSIHDSYLIDPLGITITNLHSVKVFGIQLTTALFFFVLWLGSAIGVTVFRKDYYMRIHKRKGTSDRMHHLQLLFYPIMIGTGFVFLHALGTWSIVLAVNGVNSFSPVQDSMSAFRTLLFLWYLGLCPLFINATMHQLLPSNVYSVASPLFLVINLVSAGSLYDYVQVPVFFKYGYMLPMRFAVRQFKVMFFGALVDTEIVNLIVISLWIFVPAVVYLSIIHHRIKKFNRTEFPKSSMVDFSSK